MNKNIKTLIGGASLAALMAAAPACGGSQAQSTQGGCGAEAATQPMSEGTCGACGACGACGTCGGCGGDDTHYYPDEDGCGGCGA